MANISYTFAETVTTTVVSSGTTSSGAEAYVPWSNPSNAERPGNINAYATASITAANQETDWLVATNFNWQRDVPAGATIVGVIAWVEGIDDTDGSSTSGNTIQVVDAQLVVGGSRTGTDQSGSGFDPVLGHDQNPGILGAGWRHSLWAGGEDNTWGASLTPANVNASDFGVAFRFGDDGTGTSTTIKIDTIQVIVYWTATADCVITSSDNDSTSAASGMAPYSFHAHATESTWDACDPDKVAFKWAVSGPAGWSQTVTDPRPGASVNGQTRDLATDAWGYNMAWWFDVPGTYTVTATMYYNDTSTGAILTDTSNTITVTVAANTRTKYRVAASGGDYTTLAAAVTAAGSSNDIEIELEDGHTEDLICTIGGNNWWIHTESGYTTKAKLRANAQNIFSNFGKSGLILSDLQSDTSGTVGVDKHGLLGGSSMEGLTVVDCEGVNYNSVAEIASSLGNKRHMWLRFHTDSFDRYIVYLQGEGSQDFVAVGCYSKDDGSNGAEGHYRLNPHSMADTWGTTFASEAQRANFLWNEVDGTTGKGVRPGWAFVHSFQNRTSGTARWGVTTTVNDENGLLLTNVHRLDGNYCSPGDGAWGTRHFIFVNCIFPDNNKFLKIGTEVTYRTAYIQNTHLGLGNNSIHDNSRGDTAYCYNMQIGGSLFVMSSDAEFGTSGLYVVMREGWDYWEWSKYNCYAQGTVSSGQANRFAVPLGGTTFAPNTTNFYEVDEFQATSKSTGDVQVDYEDADILDSNDFLPTSTTAINQVATGTHRNGVFVDYRGVLRDSDASTWLIGAVGAEAAPAPSSTTTTTTTSTTTSTFSTSSEPVPSYLALSAGSQFIILET